MSLYRPIVIMWWWSCLLLNWVRLGIRLSTLCSALWLCFMPFMESHWTLETFYRLYHTHLVFKICPSHNGGARIFSLAWQGRGQQLVWGGTEIFIILTQVLDCFCDYNTTEYSFFFLLNCNWDSCGLDQVILNEFDNFCIIPLLQAY